MKLCNFVVDNKTKQGIIEGDLVYVFDGKNKIAEKYQLSAVEFALPTNPTKIVCVGRNYAEHAAELGNEIPKQPLLFLKAPSALILNGEEIVIPQQSEQVEHEGELGVVIGKKCKNLTSDDDPFDYVKGYVCLNDVTARDLQKKDVQFTRAKSFDTFCPLGHFIETELNPADISVKTTVNGVVKQFGKTSQMVFPVEFLIRYISQQMTLFPGDIIATGTPSGVSKLENGDICEVEIEGIGTLRNGVVNEF